MEYFLEKNLAVWGILFINVVVALFTGLMSVFFISLIIILSLISTDYIILHILTNKEGKASSINYITKVSAELREETNEVAKSQLLIELDNFLVNYGKKTSSSRILFKRKIHAWLLLAINIIFAFIIGLSIQTLATRNAISYVFIFFTVIPFLLVPNYVILDWFNYNINGCKRENSHKGIEEPYEGTTYIKFKGRKYAFSKNHIVLFAVGAPLLAFGLYFALVLAIKSKGNYWLHRIVANHANLVLSMFISGYTGRGIVETQCTGIDAICIIAGIIICVPHSQFQRDNREIVWRKCKTLVVSSVVFYVLNLIRLVITFTLWGLGFGYKIGHDLIAFYTAIVASIIIFTLLYKWIPEFVLSLIYPLKIIKTKVEIKNSEENSLKKEK